MMRTWLLLSALLLALPAPALAQQVAQPIDRATKARIDRILKKTPLIDGHNDLPWALREDFQMRVDDLQSGSAGRTPPLMTDMARLRQGRVGGQLWSVYISGTITGGAAVLTTLQQIDVARRLIDAYPKDLALARTADDMVRIHRSGRIGSMLGAEGGNQMGESMAALRQYYDLGVRYMTLTHNQTTSWADSATDEPKHDGISAYGATVIAEMNRLGMLLDLSHVSPAAMVDALAMTKAPVIFSHSNAYALNPHPRNVPDNVLRLLTANGGLVMVNFYPVFLSAEVAERNRRRIGEEARLKATTPFSAAQVKAGMEAWDRANPAPPVPVALVADHIEHIARVAGHDHVGLGGDLDGVPTTAVGLEGVDGYPLLFAELIRRGWSDANLAKLAGGNFLRALRRAEVTAAEMKKTMPPALDKLP
jgi:membrane dipeptidase